ncbi:multidrug resistance-associated protein 1-like [Polypterus senegalus]|uniref:multidrug resistance-associated protein 1-like n=1 Tax=Polypterus senegalus TaxID=55291 RepID=UPI0019639AD1|nr:multidrug resistance-associated protein 1-like [Polypterus senegalus]
MQEDRKQRGLEASPPARGDQVIHAVIVALSFRSVKLAAPSSSWHGSPEKRHPAGDKNPNPERNVSYLSWLTYWWFNRIITLGYKRPLQREDLFELNDHDSPYTVCPAFEKHWKEEHIQWQKGHREDEESLLGPRQSRKPSLFRALWRTFSVLFIQVFLLKLLADMLAFVSPQVLKLLIAFCENQPLLDWSGPTYALVLFVAASYTLILQVYHRLNMLAAAKIKTAVIGLIYKKALSITNSSRRKFTTGEVVNLMSADAQQLMDMALNMNLLWSAPFQILLAVYFLWKELGAAVMAGLAVLLLVIPLNAFVASRVKHLKKTHMKAKDQRLKLLNEILHGIKILKLYAWEPSFLQKIVKVREGEMEVLKSSGYLTAFSMLTLTCVPFLVSMASFGVFVMTDNENVLTASTVFTSISLFNILRLPLFDLPTVISSIVQTKISLGRLERFICCDELDPTSVQTEYLGGHAVGFVDASFRWEKTGCAALRELNLKIADESLVAVVGQVGAGKSSLLSAILGEMEKVEGLLQRKGTVAYVSQQAWIQNATLQENILFGAEMIESRYHLVMEACCLLPDLELLPHGDQTEIGERGVNLSGGQKQRVSLARAVYADADIYLLDDPLSAVDVHVGNQLLEKVIGPAGLLKNKTRVLVTNSTVVLPLADQILVMDEGRIIEMGSYEKLLSDKRRFADFLEKYCSKPEEKSRPEAEEMHKKDESNVKHGKVSTGSSHENKGRLLMKKEEVATGSVKGSVILKYLNSFGTFWVTLTMMAYISQNVVSLGQNWLLRTWTDEAKQVQEMAKWIELRDSRLRMYGELGVIQALAVCFGAFVLTKGTLQASRTLHHQMLDSILHLPLLFFETTPIGQLVSRSTKDIYVIDERFHYYLRTWFNCLLDVMATIVVIIVATPLFAVAIVPLAILYFSIQRYYIASSRQIRRLDGASRSPVISHFSETLLGVSTIRAFGYQDRFISQNKEVIYENLVCYYNNVISNRWLAVRLEFVGNLMIFLAALFMVKNKSHLDSGTVGLAMTYALNITATLNFWVRKACEIETNAVAIERICEYSEMDKEAPWTLPTRPPAVWPEQGVVRFDKYEARYKRNLEPALHDVSFQTLSKEKVGIVGRTGAGKSTLTNCLFRILEASKGRIFIDGVDISAIGLHDLREKLNIIPQDPVLFSGTIRENLDPLGSHSDSELWMALELCHLKDFVQSLPKHIHHEVAEGGENLSVGQRQLLCLTRALLRKTKVLILDEATASIDLETDNLVQMTIRKTFSDCTILTIAHRLHTIMDSDRVLVLDSGRVVEFDSPENLLEKGGVFYHMVSEAGITGSGKTKTTNRRS